MKRKARRFLSGCLAALLLASAIPVEAASGNAQEVWQEEESVSSEILTEPEQASEEVQGTEQMPEEVQEPEETPGQEGNAGAVLPREDVEVQPELKEDPAYMNEQMEIVEELLGDDVEQALAGEDEEGLPMVRLGDDYSAAVKTDGSLWMWGDNEYGQLGDGTFRSRSKPVKVMEGVKRVFLSGDWSTALKTDGSLWRWGKNDGCLGDGTTKHRNEPVKVLEGVKMTNGMNAAIKTDGSLWMWGWSNGLGQFENETLANRSKPVKVMEGVKSVAMGQWHSAVIKTDGSLWMWGDNENGQLGDGTTTNRSEPVKVMEGVKSVSLSGVGWHSYSAALKTDGSLWMWGDNDYGELGDGTTTERHEPVKVMEGVKSIPPSWPGTALKTDGSLWIWGNNEPYLPEKTLTGVKNMAVSRRNNYGAAVKTDGSLWMWGPNHYGQLGDGTTTNRSEPVKVMEGVKSVSHSEVWLHNAAIKTDGSLWMWGRNDYGELGDGTKTHKSSPMKIMDLKTNTPKPSVTPSPKPVSAKNQKSKTAYYDVSQKGTAQYLRPTNGNLQSVTIPSTVKIKGVTYKVTSIGNKAFINNKKLKKVAISDNIITIGNSAFQGCKALKTVTIGKRVKTIGQKAFYGDGRLTAITVKSAALKKVGGKALYGIHKKAVIKAPAKQLSAYKKLFKNKGQKKTVKFKKI